MAFKKSPNPRFMKKGLAPFAHQKEFELAPFAPKKKSELAPLRDRKAKIARCGAPRKTSGAGLVALRPRGLGQILPRKALDPPRASLRRHLRSKLGLRPRSGARRRSRPEARSGQRRGREYLLLAGLRAERTWGVFSNTFSAMPIVLIDVQREGEEIWRDDERCRWWRGGARRARRRRLGAGGFIKHHSYLPDRQRRHITAARS